MNPDLNGRRATLEAACPWVILATDKLQTGQPIRAVTQNCQHVLGETRNFRMARFATRREAEVWMDENQLRLRNNEFTYTVILL